MKKLTQKALDAQYRVFNMLSNLNRLSIINTLRAAKKPITATELAHAVNCSMPTVYEQLAALRVAGIVKPAKRSGPNQGPIELSEAFYDQALFDWAAQAATFKSLFKPLKRAPQLRVVEELDL